MVCAGRQLSAAASPPSFPQAEASTKAGMGVAAVLLLPALFLLGMHTVAVRVELVLRDEVRGQDQ